MTVLAHELHWTGATGNRSLDGKSQFEAIYRCRTNDANDQADTVLNYFQNLPSGPYLGFGYEYANDFNETLVCTNIRPRRANGSATTWEVTFTYETQDSTANQQLDESGNPTDDPLRWRPQISMSWAQFTEPVWKAKYRGGFVGTAAAKTPDGKEMMPCNSTLITPFDPPLERDLSRPVIRITRYSDAFGGDQARDQIDTVNSVAFEINYLNFTMRVFKWTAKINSIEPELEDHTVTRGGRKVTLPFWRITKQFEINPNTWLDEVPDRGIHARMDAGDPDGRGGSISFEDLVDGQARLRRLLDNDEMPINEPVLLNGDGQPLQPGADTVWIKWQKYRVEDFKADLFFRGVIR